MDAGTLADVLKLDFRAPDFGDTPTQFRTRLDVVTQAATGRTGATDAQVEADARYRLLDSQLRQLTRRAERIRGASGSEVEQGLSVRIAEVRTQRDQQYAASGLNLTGLTAPSGSMALPVEVGF